MMKYIVLIPLVIVSCTKKENANPWTSWVGKLEARYQEKFSSPSIVHHIYLEKEEDEFYIQKTTEGYRWTRSICKGCQSKVTLGKDLKVIWSHRTEDKKIDLAPKKETLIDEENQVYLSANPYPKENKVRVFIYDLKQENLNAKRKRSFFPYQEKEKMSAEFHWLEVKEAMVMSRSDGTNKDMNIVAKIKYKANGKDGEFAVYDYGVSDESYKEEKKIMLIYRDFSNGKSTYGAGRFLTVDLKKKLKEMKNGDKVEIDLNYSYNPPCSVSTGFHCPLPQDMVSREVLAGEKYDRK